jgi:hypothetical protein
MYKINSRDSSKFKGCSPHQLSCNMTGKHHAIGYYSYTNRYRQVKALQENLILKSGFSAVINYIN